MSHNVYGKTELSRTCRNKYKYKDYHVGMIVFVCPDVTNSAVTSFH